MHLWWRAAAAAVLSVPGAGVLPSSSPPGRAAAERPAVEYVVVAAAGADQSALSAALAGLGAEVVRAATELGTLLVRSRHPGFAAAASAVDDVAGVARHLAIGRTGATLVDVGAASHVAAAPLVEGAAWHDAMVRVGEAHLVEAGRPGVLVGVVDTGIDASHPELAGTVDLGLSRNFTTDDPRVDGSCASDPDGSCTDPADVDENGHGTHVAGTIAAALDGRGTRGVAPGVRLVNLRAGQDSGFFLLQPVLDAITHAADVGVDVLNLSFFVDPWLFACPANPADSPAEQAEQRAILEAMSRALAYAHDRDVTVVAALGNAHADLANPTADTMSPTFPPGGGRMRWVDESCRTVPAELDHVFGVVAVGPSGKKADYSNHGEGVADIAAPGGYLRDQQGPGGPHGRDNLVLAPFPQAAASALGLLGESGEPTGPEVVRDCVGDRCAYYAYLQGTSMAAPHVAGAAALVVSRAGAPDPTRGGLWMAPDAVEAQLSATARDTACPSPALTYAAEMRPTAYDALCVGGPAHNSVYGAGIVDAAAAVAAPGPEPAAGPASPLA